MIRTCCDSCSEEIDVSTEWFGVDHWLPDDDMDDDEPEVDMTENTYHFCSAACMSAWAFDRGLIG